MTLGRPVTNPGGLLQGTSSASVDEQRGHREGQEDDEDQPDDRPEKEEQRERGVVVDALAPWQGLAVPRDLHYLPGLAAQVGAVGNGLSWTVPSPHLGPPCARERRGPVPYLPRSVYHFQACRSSSSGKRLRTDGAFGSPRPPCARRERKHGFSRPRLGPHIHQAHADGKLHKFRAVVDVQLLHDIGPVGHDGLSAQGQQFGDLPIAETLGQELQHLLFPVA